MKISKVTMTGADDSINHNKLAFYTAKYPFVEWGILLSRNAQGQNRFPSKEWIRQLHEMVTLEGIPMQLSGHLCGSWVRELLMGNDAFIVKEIGIDEISMFQRIQINTHGYEHKFDAEGLVNTLQYFPDTEFIIQYDNANLDILNFLRAFPQIKCSALFDLSHGAGVVPSEWPMPIAGLSCGYAGGLSPDNVEQQIEMIQSKVGDEVIWIDMETHIRSENDRLFDLKKVDDVLETCLNTGLIA